MKWFATILLICGMPLAAQHESNFGRVILAKCDAIVQGVASAKRTTLQDLVRVEVAVENTLYGKEAAKDVQVFFKDADTLKKDEAVRGLFALKAMSSGGYELIGRPVSIPAGDPEEKDKIAVAKAFIALEAQKAGDERTDTFRDLLEAHVRQGGYAAQNAGIELMFMVKDRPGIITEEYFGQMRKAVDESTRVLTQQAAKDLKLGLQGMVEARIKSLKFRKLRRADTKAGRETAVKELAALQEAFQRAFTEADAKLCDALYDIEKDAGVCDKLAALATAIRAAEAQRKAEEERKARRPAGTPAPSGE
jgi:hypothetical protein